MFKCAAECLVIRQKNQRVNEPNNIIIEVFRDLGKTKFNRNCLPNQTIYVMYLP